jgi:hypothetical protein
VFRRIELIEHVSRREQLRAIRRLSGVADLPARVVERITDQNWKQGLMGLSRHRAVAEAWMAMPAPRRLSKNTRFYFTEAGWRQYGRPTVAACQTVGQRYRVIAIKERSVDVLYRDAVQVAVRPKKKRTQKEW